jgi:regulator of sirC expression with transglutaminase-like and TPR domain
LLRDEDLPPAQVYYWSLLEYHGYLARWAEEQKVNPSLRVDMDKDPLHKRLYRLNLMNESLTIDALQSYLLAVKPKDENASLNPTSTTGSVVGIDPIQTLCELPEEGIDIGKAALVLAKDMYPTLDTRAYLSKLKHLVEAAQVYAGGITDPDSRIRELNSFLYREQGFSYDVSDPYGRDLRNSLITGVLDTKKGQCVTLPLLYLVVARRLGYPVYAVSMPDHMFLRYVDPKLKEQNIEASSNGGYNPNSRYVADFSLTPESIKSGAYLKTLSNRELLGLLVEKNAISQLYVHGDLEKAIRYSELAAKLYPTSPTIAENLGTYYLELSDSMSGKAAQDYQALGLSYQGKAKALGLVVLPMEEYVQKLAEMSKGGH